MRLIGVVVYHGVLNSQWLGECLRVVELGKLLLARPDLEVVKHTVLDG